MAISVILSRVASPPVVSISTIAYFRSVFMRHSNIHALVIGHLISIFFIICQGCAQSSLQPPVIQQPIKSGAWSTEEYLPLLADKKVGLIVNQTSTIGNRHLVDSLITRGINVVKIFAPEHGIRGVADAGEHINDSIDIKTGVQIFSIYGTKKKPSAKDLEGIDILVFDIQDVGVRFYTYISTLHYVMEAAGENDIPLIVLDRPNPNGHYIDGPVLDTVKYQSFVGMHPIPVVYGMTIGELGLMINGEKWIHKSCDLKVIPCTNYDHSSSYDLPIKPSPNLPNLRSILLYPGICFFEGTSGSLGRGTPSPFQVVGHPEYPDKTFSFIPKPTPGAMHPPLEGKVCYGIDLTATDVDSLFKEAKMNLSVLLDFYQKLPKDSFFNPAWFDKLAGGPGFREAIEAGKNEKQIREMWANGLKEFDIKRKPYMLYPMSCSVEKK
jgi:uncharacterized protein YbbC (DUF1343 family)